MRLAVAIILGLGALLLLYVALTIPVFAATAPLLIALILGSGSFYAWRGHRHKRSAT